MAMLMSMSRSTQRSTGNSGALMRSSEHRAAAWKDWTLCQGLSRSSGSFSLAMVLRSASTASTKVTSELSLSQLRVAPSPRGHIEHLGGADAVAASRILEARSSRCASRTSCCRCQVSHWLRSQRLTSSLGGGGEGHHSVRMLGAGELPPSAQPPSTRPVPSSPGPLVEGLADDRGDVRLAFDRKAGETLTVVIDVTLRDEGTPAVSPSAKRAAARQQGCITPCLVHSSVVQSRWAMAPLWVCISRARVVKYRLMGPTRFPSRKRSITETVGAAFQVTLECGGSRGSTRSFAVSKPVQQRIVSQLQIVRD
jgi:hypothetical protein